MLYYDQGSILFGVVFIKGYRNELVMLNFTVVVLKLCIGLVLVEKKLSDVNKRLI